MNKNRTSLVDPYFFPKKIEGEKSNYNTLIAWALFVLLLFIMYKVIFMSPLRGEDELKPEKEEVKIESKKEDLPPMIYSKKGTGEFLDDNVCTENWEKLTMDPYIYNPEKFE